MPFNRSQLPTFQKRVFSWATAYYKALAQTVMAYPDPEEIFPRSLLPHARKVHLVVTPINLIVLMYRSNDQWAAEWRDATVEDVVRDFASREILGDLIKNEIEAYKLRSGKSRYRLTALMVADYKTSSTAKSVHSAEPEQEESKRLPWEKFIVTNNYTAKRWSIDTAQGELKTDILATSISKLMGLSFTRQDVEPPAADPKKAVALELNRLIRDFEVVLADASREEEVQLFIKQHPYLLDLRAISVDPKVPLGSEYVTDFIVRLPGGEHLLVELEQASHTLFTKTNNPTAAVTHAVRQVEDWLEWSYENLSYLRSRYPEIHEPKGLVVLGRRSSLDPKAAKALRRRNVLSKVQVVTYDDLIDDMKAIAMNLERGTIPVSF
jgi:hypothetical protein